MSTSRSLRALLSGLCLAFVLASCEKEPPYEPTPEPDPTPAQLTISVSPSGTVVFPAEGGSVDFRIKTNADYYGYSFTKKDWMSAAFDKEKDYNCIVITLTANDSGEERSNVVTFYGSSEKNGEHEVETKVKVVQPAKSGSGGSTISSAGGNVKLEDFSITFPEGAVSKNSNIVVTQAEKGSVLGEGEISAFYNVTLRPDVSKPLTVSIPCKVTGDDVNVVAHIPGLQLSEGESSFCNLILESSYADGVYTATLPASGNKNLEDNDKITIGLGVARMGYLSGNNAVKSSIFDEKFTEGNVSWHFNWGYFDKITYATQLAAHWYDYNDVIREAIKTIHKLGLSVTTRDIAISFADNYIETKNGKEPLDGAFVQSAWSNESSTVEYNYFFLREYDTYKAMFRTTAIHELMHVFQADYDPRKVLVKAVSSSLDQQLLYESGAVWVEQFMGGTYSVDFTNKYLNDFVRGFEDVKTIHDLYDTAAKNSFQQYSNHGYGMSTLMQYLTNGMTEFGLGTDAIATLYKDYWKAKGLGTKACIQGLTQDRGHNIFSIDYYDKFLISLASGELIPTITAADMRGDGEPTLEIRDSKLQGQAEADCYVYGAHITKCLLNISDESILKNKELVIEQQEEGVQTYVFVPKSGGKAARIGYMAWKDNPLSIGGKDLDVLRGPNGKFHSYFYTLTTNTNNTSKKHSKIVVAIKDAASANPSSLSFPAEGGTKRVKITFGSNTRYGASVSGANWCSLSSAAGSGSSIAGDTEKDLYVDVTVRANPNRQNRSCTINFWVSDFLEEDKMKFSVKVSQDGAGMTLKMGSISFNGDFLTREHWDWSIPVADSDTRRDYSFNHSHTQNTITSTLSGTTLHVRDEYTADGVFGKTKSSISFDILNFVDKKYDKCEVSNIVFKETDQNNSGAGTSVELKMGSIPLVQVDTTSNSVSLTFKTQGSGVKVTSLTDRSDDGDGQIITHTFLGDPANKVRLYINVDRPKK